MRLRNIPRARQVLEESAVVIKNTEESKGKWGQVFGNDNPIFIEIGMGKGQFITTMAQQNPDINYVGIERYTSVLLRGVEKLNEDANECPSNLRLICMDARNLRDAFGPWEVSKIYLNFSDPWPKAKHRRRRLTSAEFLGVYHQVLKPEGQIEFKTDNRELFDFSLEEVRLSEYYQLVEYTYDLHHDDGLVKGNVMTEYEEKFSAMGNPICKLICRHTFSS